MQNTIQKFRQSSIVFEKSGILSGNLKTLTSPNYPTVQYFLLKRHTRFLLTNVYKRVCGIFFCFIQILRYLKKLKRPDFYTLVLYTFINNSLSKQNRKIPHILLQTLLSGKRVQNFSKKILNSIVVKARQSFQFFS